MPNDSAYVIDDGTIRFDPVTISGRDEYLGKKANTFHVEYSVTSLSGSGATITETLNGEVIRTYTAVDGELQTATLNAANLDERDHTFTITATSNSTNEPTERRYIFYAVPLAIHDGGTIQEFQDENSEPIFPATMASAVIAKNGKSVERLLSDLVDPNTYVWGVYQPPGQPYKIDSEVVTIAISRIVDYQNGSGTIGINYADGIECSDTVISLVNPTTWSGGMSHSNADILAETLKGKFWTHNGGIYYIPTAVEGVVTYSTGVVTAGYTSAKTSHTFKIKCQAVSISMITDMLFLGVTFSQNIDAYPENGAQDYWHYVLFGNLIESIVNSTPRLEMGQYTGTGTTGAANPCIITFKHKPRIVWICARTAVSGGYNGGQPWIYGSSAAFSGIYANGGSSSYAANLTWTGNTLKWYSNGADQQLNTSGVIYDYFSLY